MKLVFKLTMPQQLVAVALAASDRLEVEDGCKIVKCGSFYVADYGYGVAKQDLTVGEGTLTYEGGRTTLKKGMLRTYTLLLKIFGSQEAAEKALVVYQTTAQYLKWYEMEVDALPRASTERLLELVEKARTWRTECSDAASEEIEKRYGKYRGKSQQWLSATFSTGELVLIRKALKAVQKSDC